MILFLVIAVLSVGTIVSQSQSFSFKELIYDLKTIDHFWMLMAILGMIGFIVFEGLAVSHLVKGLTGLHRYREGIMYGAADVYFSAITPSASGGQPASAWFMISDGIPTAKTTVVLLANLILYTYALLLCGIAAFLMKGSYYFEFPLLARLLILSGAIVLLALGILFEMLLRHEIIIERVGYWCIHLALRFHLIHSEEHWKARLLHSVRQYKDCAGMIRGKSRLLWETFGLNLAQRLSHSLVTVALYMAVGGRVSHIPDIWSIQILTNVGSNTIPIPGAMGVADYLLICGLDLIHDIDNPANLELMCRGISFYICVLVSIIIIGIGYFRRTSKKKKA